MVDLATFKVWFPEMALDGSATSDAFIQSYLDRAEHRIGPAFSDLEDKAHGYLAAHLMSLSPYGATAQLSKTGDTWYSEEFKRMQRIAALGRGRVCAPDVPWPPHV